MQWEITEEFDVKMCSTIKIPISAKHQVLKNPFYAEVIIIKFSLHICFFLAFPNAQLDSSLQYVGGYLN